MGDGAWALRALWGAIAVAMAVAATAAVAVPLPRPRPAEAPASGRPPPPTVPRDGDAGRPDAPPGTELPATPPLPASPTLPSADAAPTPCRLALTEEMAVAPSIPAIAGPGGCGGTDLVRLEAVIMPDTSRVAFKPPAILRCALATALVEWVRGDLAALARTQGASLREIDNFDSYECRGRNRVMGARLSEHGRANAIDIRGVRLTSDVTLGFTDRAAPKPLRESIKASVCARFATVLGPGSDWYHEDHVHLDLAERRSGYRICQWEMFEPLPESPPLPLPRPADAPAGEGAQTTPATAAD